MKANKGTLYKGFLIVPKEGNFQIQKGSQKYGLLAVSEDAAKSWIDSGFPWTGKAT